MYLSKLLINDGSKALNIINSKMSFHTTPIMRDPLMKKFKVYRYDPDSGKKPHYQDYEIDLSDCGFTVLHALTKIKNEQDSTLTYRRSCREGNCGSCAININGLNALSCITKINRNVKKVDKVRPLPHSYVIKDLVINMNYFFKQYKEVEPWLQRKKETRYGNHKQHLQTEKEAAVLDRHYECILCAACSYSCPSYWWNGTQDRFPGPAALLHTNRWVMDSRDEMQEKRLKKVANTLGVYRCHTIMNCIPICPKGLNPAKSIANLKGLLAGVTKKPRAELAE